MSYKMGNHNSKPEDRLRAINRDVNSIRSSIKISKVNMSKTKKEHIVETLVQHSSDVSSMRGKLKRKDIDGTLKAVSEAMEEVLKIEANDLDGGTVESDSFVNVPLGRRSTSLGSLRNIKKSKEQLPAVRNSVRTLRDIEAKIEDLKIQISTAVASKSTNQLRVCKETIKVLAADLEMLVAEKDTPFAERKESVSKKIMGLYKKVNQSLNELKKTNQAGNSKADFAKKNALSQLTDIELRLAENESLLDGMIKQKNPPDFITVRNNIVEQIQNLAKVDSVDNEIKEKVILLTQKVTESVNNLDQIMAKNEFESKFSKLSNNYKRIMRNFDGSTNAHETLDNLQILRNSLDNLEEINDASKDRKNELVQTINEEIAKMSDVASDQKIVEDIVEDNVILRKKVKSTDKEHTVIDQFINYWINVKTNFNVNSYSNLSLLRIDSILEDMQESINEVRTAIAKKCDTNPPSNLVRKRSQSVPKLNSKVSYGSTKSMDQIDNKVIKAKVKVYDMPASEVQKVDKTTYVNNRFSKIEEIKMQVYYIKEKIGESHNKDLLKEKLEQYRNELNNYSKDPNQAVAFNANLVTNEIVELLHQTGLVEIRKRVETLSKKVHNFSGTKYDKDFEIMKIDLLKVRLELENFKVPTQYNTLQMQKDELLDEIFNNLESLQEKGSYYRKYEDEKVREIKNKLQELNDRVKGFSGTYRGVLYNKIDRDLNKLLIDIGEQVEDQIWSKEMIKETERLLKILEQRSSLVQSFRGNKSSETQPEEQRRMAKIKRDLNSIKKEIDSTHENDVDAFVRFQSRLDLVNLELGQITIKSNENLTKEKEICSNEAQTLRSIVDAKVTFGQQPGVHWSDTLVSSPKFEFNQEMEQLERTFGTLKTEIASVNYIEGADKYYSIAQDIKKLIQKLSGYSFMRGSDLQQKQVQLLNNFQYYVQALEKESSDIKHVLNIERKLNKLETALENTRQLPDFDGIRKETAALQEALNCSVSDNLNLKKTDLQHKTEMLIEKLMNKEEQEKQIQRDRKKIQDIQEKIAKLEPQISTFVGLKEENKFYELNESTIRATLALDRIEAENDDIHKQRIKLLKILHNLGNILDEREKQTRIIVNLEKDLEAAATMQESFNGQKAQAEAIEAKIKDIRTRLQGLKVVNELIDRKNACSEKCSVLFNKTLTLNVSSPIQSNTFDSWTIQQPTGYTSQFYNFTDVKNNDLNEIETKVNEIEEQLKETSDINRLKQFDDALLEFGAKLKQTPNDPRQHKLYDKIQNLTDLIEENMQDHDRLSLINNEVDELINEMNNSLTHEQISQIESRLNQLLVELRKLNNMGLKKDMDACAMKIILSQSNIADRKA